MAVMDAETQESAPPLSGFDAFVLEASRGHHAFFSYYIRNVLQMGGIPGIETSEVLRSLKRLEQMGLVRRARDWRPGGMIEWERVP